MTTSEYEAYVQFKCQTPIGCSYLGLAGEVGEVLDLIKKATYHGHQLEDQKLISELGDILFYLTDIIVKHGFTIEQVMLKNKEKLDKRYKGAFTQEESINRK